MRKKLPIGIENFKEFSSEDFYYVDKTLFIKELVVTELGKGKFVYPSQTLWQVPQHEHAEMFF